MNSAAVPDELRSKNLCHACIGEAYLSAEVAQNGVECSCSYCDRTAKSYTIGALAERIEDAFAAHYVRTSDQPHDWEHPLLADREMNYGWERDGEPVVWAIANAAEISEDAATDIQTILEDQHFDVDAHRSGEESEFDIDSYYEETGTTDHAWQGRWREFERSLKSEARFFSRTAIEELEAIFQGIETMLAVDGAPLIIDAGPGTELSAVYRARAFQSDERLKEALCRPDRHLGSPPAQSAGAGRMNARGISVFYGADDPGAALAEVRPPVGSQVAVARFDIVRALRLLDLTALGAVVESGSIFDTGLAARLERAMFLRSLSERITRPVMPDDEVFEYLPTQAIADFLATENNPPLDGILFPSVQAAGNVLNVVLFHKAARVGAMEILEGTVLEASTGMAYEEGWEIDYRVDARSTGNTSASSPHMPFFEAWTPPDPDRRDVTLRIDVDSLRVHRVRRVTVETDEFPVHRDP